VQVGERALELLQDAVQLVLGDRGVRAQGVEERALAVELLQQVALQVRAARDLQDLEHAGEARVVGVRMRLAEEEANPVVQVLEP
jgi:hypothetical protein